MRRWLLSFLLVLTTCMCGAQTVRNFPSLETDNLFKGQNSFAHVNSSFYVGQVTGLFPSIQSAVTAACLTSGARVVIPAGSVPTDTVAGVTGGCSTAVIVDQRSLPDVCYAWATGPYAATSCGGGGGGSSFPGTNHQVVVSAGSGTAFASKATLDAPGNSQSLSNDGLVNAFMSQTTPTSNNGIFNALLGVGNTAVAGPDYAAVEAVITGTYRTPLVNFFGTQVGSPAWAEQTGFTDYRNGNRGGMNYQTGPGTTAFINTKTLNDHVADAAGSGQTWTVEEDDWIIATSGKNQQILGLFGPDGRIRHYNAMLDLAEGISNWDTTEVSILGGGDHHTHQNLLHANGFDDDGSAEGHAIFRNQVDQTSNTWISHANATLAPGALQLTGTTDSGVNPSRGSGQLLLDISQGTASFQILTTTLPDNNTPTPGVWTTDATWTPDNIGHCAVALNNNVNSQQYNGRTTSQSCTMTGLTAGLNASIPLCVASPNGVETAAITNLGTFSSGSQSVTVNLRNFHSANTWVSQGPQSCRAASIAANQNGALFHVYRVLGALSAHSLYYVQTYKGSWIGGPGGSFNTLQIPAGTMTRDSAGIVTVILGFADTAANFQGDGIHVLGSVDSTYNGAFCCVVETVGASTTTLTWPTFVTGAAGSTTTAQNIQLIANGVPSNLATLYPATRITYPGDITLHSYTANGNNSVEATNWTVNNGDQIFAEPMTAVFMGLEHNNVIHVTPGPAGNQVNTLDYFVTGRIPDNYIFGNYEFTDDPHAYLGMGGTKAISATFLNMNGASNLPFRDIFNVLAPTDAVLNITSCGPFGCTAQNADYDIIRALGNSNELEMNWAVHTNTLEMHIGGTAIWNMTPTQHKFAAQGTGPNGSTVTIDGDAGIKLNVQGASNFNSNFVVMQSGAIFDRPMALLTAIDADPAIAALGIGYGLDSTFTSGKSWQLWTAGSAGYHGLAAGHIGLYDSTDIVFAMDCSNTGCSFPGTVTAASGQFTGTANGFFGLTATGVSPGAAPTNTIQIEAPNSVTGYRLILPGSNPSTGPGFMSCTPANPSVCSWLPSTFVAQTDAATVTWGIGSAPIANGSLTFTTHGGSRTLNLTGLVNGGSYVLWLKQDGTGGEGLTLGSGCTWKVGGGGAGSITLSSAANATDILAFTYDGTNCYANFNTNFN